VQTCGAENATVTIVALDSFGNKLGYGGLVFNITWAGPYPVESMLIDHGDGTYTLSYFIEHSGVYILTILVNGTELGANHPSHSPWTITVSSGGSLFVFLVVCDCCSFPLSS